MFYVKFTFNGANRKREMVTLPRVGEIVDLPQGDGQRLLLRVDLVIHFIEDDGNTSWHCNSTQMQDWLTKAQ